MVIVGALHAVAFVCGVVNGSSRSLQGFTLFCLVSYGKGFRSTWAAWDVDSVK